MKKIFVVLCLLLALPVCAIEVVFINPSMKGNDFWDQVNEVALAASDDLNSPNWSRIDFRQFSLSNQTDLNYYQFDFSKVLKQLTQ